MASSKVTITKHKSIVNKHPLEDQVGLSSFDLALIALNKIINNNKSTTNPALETTFLI